MPEIDAMYDKWTDRARKVMQLAKQEVERFNHDSIGTEHILLGLVRGPRGVAASVLLNYNIDPRKVRLEVEKLVQSGLDIVLRGKLPQTPRAKKVIEYSMEEARNLNHNYVGTEHILLGLLRDREGVAGIVLESLGLILENVRREVLDLLGPGKEVTNERKSLRVVDGCLVECGPPIRKVCCLGLGGVLNHFVILHFPDGREEGVAFGASDEVLRTYAVLQEWLEAQLNEMGDKTADA